MPEMILESNGQIRVAAITDVGQKREHNEDNLLVDKDAGLLMVADGMGGHEAGEVASHMAVEIMHEQLSKLSQRDEIDATEQFDLSHTMPTEVNDKTLVDIGTSSVDRVREAIGNANSSIFGQNKARDFPDGMGMGTTLAGIWLLRDDGKSAIFHVGDCRIYRYRGGELSLLTKDHTLYQEWQERGCKGKPPQKNIILRALGPRENVKPDVNVYSFKKVDKILICSDGLTGMLTDEQISQVFHHTEGQPPEIAARYFIDLANQFGGHDNITAIVAHIL